MTMITLLLVVIMLVLVLVSVIAFVMPLIAMPMIIAVMFIMVTVVSVKDFGLVEFVALASEHCQRCNRAPNHHVSQAFHAGL